MYSEAHSLRISHFLRPPAARFLGSLKKKGASLQTKGELVLRCAEVPELFSLHVQSSARAAADVVAFEIFL